MTGLLSNANGLSLSIDNGKCVDVAYFDFSKVFDSVRYDYLINKFYLLGIKVVHLKWVIYYFEGRIQMVIKWQRSPTFDITTVV